jgi:ectoine hydroxylase-related dioxygenase (phytanoyl-CoA dioxygenase family)
MNKTKYSTDVFSFKEKLEQLFSVNELSSLNENILEVFTREKDQSTKYHKLYYDWARTDEFTQLYDKFILEIIKPLYNEQIVYQAIPTFRIAYPDNIAVGEFHKDKFYRDVNWANEVQEDNFFLPFTDAFDTNTIWVESQEDKNDYSPMNCNHGEVIQWDGSNLMHGNKVNKTGKTRVSVDFRIIKYSKYKPSEHGSINTNSKFQIGEYYKTI